MILNVIPQLDPRGSGPVPGTKGWISWFGDSSFHSPERNDLHTISKLQNSRCIQWIRSFKAQRTWSAQLNSIEMPERALGRFSWPLGCIHF